MSLFGILLRHTMRYTHRDMNCLVKNGDKTFEKGILGAYTEPLVSGDFNHDPRSSIVDLNGTKVVEGGMVRVASWYDNEWGFSCRMLDTALAMHKVGY